MTMNTTKVASLFFGLAAVVLLAKSPWAVKADQAPNVGAVLSNTCLITNDVRGMTDFYARVLQIEPRKSGDSYVEFRTSAGTLALFAADAQEKYIPGSATAARNQSAILEFRVSDPDREYARLRDFVKWVKGPTTQPWGTRSIYFRDPDGNLVDFFAPVQSSQ
jgi:catechol 2,3-dioxygenase-like lactoylglutathione lyase family enzyme